MTKETLLRFKVDLFATTNMSYPKTLFLVNSVSAPMFSMLMIMCRDPDDTMSKVSCCVEP